MRRTAVPNPLLEQLTERKSGMLVTSPYAHLDERRPSEPLQREGNALDILQLLGQCQCLFNQSLRSLHLVHRTQHTSSIQKGLHLHRVSHACSHRQDALHVSIVVAVTRLIEPDLG